MKFSKNVSKQPRKQRLALYCAPLHKARSFLHCHLSKELRKREGKRAILVRKGDRVKVMRGENKGKNAAVVEVNYKGRKVFLEGFQVTARRTKKQALVAFEPSNLLITELSERKKKQKAKNELQKT
jgi:large subunit ribosomal protein L24